MNTVHVQVDNSTTVRSNLRDTLVRMTVESIRDLSREVTARCDELIGQLRSSTSLRQSDVSLRDAELERITCEVADAF